jgi:uncharacterized protein
MTSIYLLRCALLSSLTLLLGVIPAIAADDSAGSSPPKAPRILFITQSLGFKHSVVVRRPEQLSTAERAITDWGVSSNLYRCDCSQDIAKDLTKENLQNYDIVMFYTTGDRRSWPLDDAMFDYFLNDWLTQKGHGFVGIHSATDTLKDYKPYWDMVGGTFNNHPWTANSKVTVVVNDSDHPISKPWGSEFTITDEIYQFKNWQPEKTHVLMSLDIGRSVFNAGISRAIREPFHVPIAWCKQVGEGRMFYMSLGHNESTWADERFHDSMLGGIKWVLGLVPGDATPNPAVSAAQLEKGKADVAAKNAELSAK